MRTRRPEPAWRTPVEIEGHDPEGDVLVLTVVAPNTIEQCKIKDRTDELTAQFMGFPDAGVPPSGPVPDDWLGEEFSVTSLQTVASLEVMQETAQRLISGEKPPFYNHLELIGALITMDEAFGELTSQLGEVRKKALLKGKSDGAQEGKPPFSPPSEENNPIQT